MLENDITVRKVQAYTRQMSLLSVLPKSFTNEIGIEKRDFMKVRLKDSQLILEKAAI